MGLGGEGHADGGAIERDELVGFRGLLPEKHVGRQVAVNASGDAAGPRWVEFPIGARGDISQAGLLRGGAVEPASEVGGRGEVVALAVVAAAVRRHEVMEAVVGQARPRDEVVQTEQDRRQDICHDNSENIANAKSPSAVHPRSPVQGPS